MEDARIYVNGVDGTNGRRLCPPMEAACLAARIRGESPDPALVRWFRQLLERLNLPPMLGLPGELNPADPTEAGWAVVTCAQTGSRILAALEPLIRHRQECLGAERVRVLEYQPGESWRAWLTRHGAEPGSVLPERVPYYLLLAGDPEAIPFDFQHLLATEYAVGRLSFDTAEEYRRYGECVVDYENSRHVPGERSAVYFAPRHEDDPTTEAMMDLLVSPLASSPHLAHYETAGAYSLAETYGFDDRCLLGPEATRGRLRELLHPTNGHQAPALLFTATHGLGWPRGHERQRAEQGALVCQGWAGHADSGSHGLDRDCYFAAEDLADDGLVHGSVCFHFACFGGGTPQYDQFARTSGSRPPQIAERPFVARLPQRLLAHPRGSALAVIAHVERAWLYSVATAAGESQLLPFANTLSAILGGQPVGHALRDFRQRYLTLSAALSDLLERGAHGAQVDDHELASLWIERNDARNYVLLADPAVCLRSADLR